MPFRGIRIRVLFLSAALLSPSLCWPNPISLDQLHIPISDPENGIVIQNTQTVAQTFTVGLEGLLTAVELDLGCCRFGPPSADLLVEIRSTVSDGSPSDDVLASVLLRPSDLPVNSYAFVWVSLEPESFMVSPGELFSIVLSTPASVLPGGGINPYAWAGDGAGRYDRGVAYTDIHGGGFHLTGWDMGFKTYVSEVPEPASLTLLAVAGGSIAGTRMIRSRRARRGCSRKRQCSSPS